MGFFHRKFSQFIEHRKLISRRGNFIDCLAILLPIYSLAGFSIMMGGASSMKVESWDQIFFIYHFFVLLIPFVLASTHAFVFSGILKIISEPQRLKNKQTDMGEFVTQENSTTYPKNELKISQLFQKE